VTDDPRARADDEEQSLLRELRSIADQVDPVPSRLKDAARGSLTWRSLDAELAELTFDSFADEAARTVVRGGGGARLLSFQAPGEPGLEIAVEVLAERGRRRLVGQLDPAQPAHVEVRQPGGARAVETDERGRFALEASAGPASLRCRTGGTGASTTIVTDWVSI
jgi:hypothetical protein